MLILFLYLKVISFSKAKDVTNKAKQLETQKWKGLRKNLVWQTQNKVIKQISLVPNAGGYFIGREEGGGVSSTIVNIYQS